MNQNRITGIIPAQHGRLKYVKVYDVSGNIKMSGTIPSNFVDLPHLEDLIIFDTNIEGKSPIPLCEIGVSIQTDCTKIVCTCCECNN